MPAAEGQPLPQALIALAVKPLPKEAPVDQGLYRAIQFFAGLALFDYNRKNTPPIRVSTVQQGAVEVKHLSHEHLFPAGFQPALALKGGYLLLATSPEAIARFQPHDSTAVAGDAVPFVRFLPGELAKLLRQHRSKAVEQLSAKQQVSKQVAAQTFDSTLQVLELFQEATLSQRVREDQMSWILRVQMAEK